MKLRGWMSRGAALSVAVLLHVVVVAGFLSRLRVGISLSPSRDAHSPEARMTVIASILTFGVRDSAATPSTFKPLDAESLAAPTPRIDVPVAPPPWPSEDEAVPLATQPAPTAGRTGLRCEVHIHQSIQGRIQAIDFGECTGDAVWQHTLLRTIERAGQLVDPAPDAHFPPVRTLNVSTDNLSPILLAQQLSGAEVFEDKSTPNTE